MPGTNIATERERLVGTIDDLADVLASRGNAAAAQLALETGDRLADERFNVVVVGAFKRGKTTLVNALLGAEYLPAAVVPLTSVVTCITSGDGVAVEIVFADDRREVIDLAELARYVTEPGNPRNELGVRRAMLTVPHEALDDGVFLVDTPGIGSVYRHNTDVARAFLSEADAAVLVTSADPPISEAELEFLHEVREQTTRLFVVMNKADYLSSRDREEALAFTTDAVRRALGRDVEVHPVSARIALEARVRGDAGELQASGLPAFERELHGFLATERTGALLASAGARASRLVDEELVAIAVEERGLDLSAEERTRTADALEAIFLEAGRARDDLDALLARQMKRVMDTIEADLDALRRDATPRLLVRVDAALAERDELRTAAAELEQDIRSGLRDELDGWREHEDRRVDELLQEATARFGEEAQQLVARTLELSGQTLGVELATPQGAAELPVTTRFTYAFFEAPTIIESIVPDVRGYLPGKLARRKLANDFHARIGPLVDKHCGRLRYDYSQRIDDARRALQRALEERLALTERTLRDAMARSASARADDEDLRRRHDRLAADRSRLETIRDRIRLGAALEAVS